MRIEESRSHLAETAEKIPVSGKPEKTAKLSHLENERKNSQGEKKSKKQQNCLTLRMNRKFSDRENIK